MNMWEGLDLGEDYLERELGLQKGAFAMGVQSLIPVFAGQTGIIRGGGGQDNHRRARSTTQATQTNPRI